MVAAISSSLAFSAYALPDEAEDGDMYELLVHVNLLSGLVWSLCIGRPVCEGWSLCSPAVRCIFVLVFCFRALAKLNRDYHDVRFSSGSVLVLLCAEAALSGMELTPQSLESPRADRCMGALLRGGLLGFELLEWAVPVLLVSGWTPSGLWLGWVMHLALSKVDFDFSCVLIASLPFWLPQHQMLALRWLTSTPAVHCCTVAMLAVLVHPALPRTSVLCLPFHVCSSLWLIAANPLLYGTLPPLQPVGVNATASVASPCGVGTEGLAADIVHCVGRLTVLLVILNGMCPYLGLKTQATWSSLSNLRVEGGLSNHFFVPACCQLFGYTQECVTVTKTNVPTLRSHHACLGGTAELQVLQGFAARRRMCIGLHSSSGLGCLRGTREPASGTLVFPYTVPFFQLRRVVTVHVTPATRDFFVEYMHFGAPCRFEVVRGELSPGSDVRLAREPSCLLQKFLAFRSFPPDSEGGACFV